MPRKPRVYLSGIPCHIITRAKGRKRGRSDLIVINLTLIHFLWPPSSRIT